MYKHWDIGTLILYLSLAFGMAILFRTAIKYKENKEDRKNKISLIIYIIMYLVLIFIACTRTIAEGIGGTDAIEYIKQFQTAEFVKFDFLKILMLEGKEPIFYNMFYIVRLLTTDYHWVFFIIYSVIICAYVYFWNENLKDYKKWAIIILTILPFINSFNVIRNSMAVAVGLFALTALKKDKKVLFFVLAVTSTLIHYTGIVLILFYVYNRVINYIIANKKFHPKIKPHWIVGALIPFELILIPIIKQYLSKTGYSSYLDLEFSLLGYLPFAIMMILTIVFYKDLTEKLKKDNNLIHYNTFTFNFLMLPILIPFNGPSRVNIYFDMSRYLLWGYMNEIIQNKLKELNILNEKNQKIYNIGVICIIIAWIIFRIYRSWEGAGIMPYYNDWIN